MIRANRQVIPDRKLFDNIHKHSNSLQIDCEPHTHSDLSHIATSMFNDIQLIMKKKLEQLDRKIARIDGQVNRLKAIIKYKIVKEQKKLYSFANSPNQKKQHEIPQSAKKYNSNQVKYGQNSTQAKTQQKTKQVDLQKQQISYLSEEIIFLHQQVLQLKSHIDKAHPRGYNSQGFFNLSTQKNIYSKENNINQSNRKAKNGNRKQDINLKPRSTIHYEYDLQEMLAPYQIDEKEVQNETISRYKNVIMQYKKQEQILRIMAGNAQKYKDSLRSVLDWVREFKQEQLQKYMPCQACRIKNFVLTFLDNEKNTHKHHNKRGKTDLKRLEVYNYQQQDSYIQNYQIISPQDQLLVEYQKQNESDDEFSLSDG